MMVVAANFGSAWQSASNLESVHFRHHRIESVRAANGFPVGRGSRNVLIAAAPLFAHVGSICQSLTALFENQAVGGIVIDDQHPHVQLVRRWPMRVGLDVFADMRNNAVK